MVQALGIFDPCSAERLWSRAQSLRWQRTPQPRPPTLAKVGGKLKTRPCLHCRPRTLLYCLHGAYVLTPRPRCINEHTPPPPKKQILTSRSHGDAATGHVDFWSQECAVAHDFLRWSWVGCTAQGSPRPPAVARCHLWQPAAFHVSGGPWDSPVAPPAHSVPVCWPWLAQPCPARNFAAVARPRLLEEKSWAASSSMGVGAPCGSLGPPFSLSR